MRNVFEAVNGRLETLRQGLELEAASDSLARVVEDAVRAFETEGYELDESLTLDDLIEAAEEWLEAEAAEDMQEKAGGFGFKFGGKDKGRKKTPSGMKMVFGRLVKVGKQFAKKLGFGKAKVKVKPKRPTLKPLAKKPLAKKPLAKKPSSPFSVRKKKVSHDGEEFTRSTSTNKKTGSKETIYYNKAGKAVATGDEDLAKAKARSKAGKNYWDED